MRIAGPLLVLPYLILRFVYGITIAWWFSPIQQWRADARLWRDAQLDMPFLFEKRPRRIRRIKPLPFDYASIVLQCEKLRISISRGRGEVVIAVSPDDEPRRARDLRDLIRELHRANDIGSSPPTTLTGYDYLFHMYWDDIARAISEQE
jgi:hypothetical protein